MSSMFLWEEMGRARGGGGGAVRVTDGLLIVCILGTRNTLPGRRVARRRS